MKQNLNKTKKDETGKSYGKWTVLEVSSKVTLSQTTYWTCQCCCGKIKDVLGTSLRNGSSTSCGCIKPSPKAIPESIFSKHYRSYKYGAKRKTTTYEFSLSFEDYKKLVQLPCHYCGQEPYDIKFLYNRKSKKDKSLDISVKINGIDRLDNNLGYILSNCVSCCKMCNLMKLSDSEESFLNQVKLIYENRKLNEKVSVNPNN